MLDRFQPVGAAAEVTVLQDVGLRQCALPQVVASDDPKQIGAVDLILFTVKLWDTESATRAQAPLLAAHTRVMTLQNGIDSIEMISHHVPRAQVIGGSIYVSAVIARPGVISSVGNFHRIVVDAAGGDRVVADFVAAWRPRQRH